MNSRFERNGEPWACLPNKVHIGENLFVCSCHISTFVLLCHDQNICITCVKPTTVIGQGINKDKDGDVFVIANMLYLKGNKMKVLRCQFKKKKKTL